MSIEGTIQSLYTDIAAIKEFICVESKDVELIQTFDNIVVPQLISLPVKIQFITVSCETNLYLSRVLDRVNADYDEFTYDGFGSICQVVNFGSKYYGYEFQKISRKFSIFERQKNVRFVRVRPRIDCKLSVSAFGTR